MRSAYKSLAYAVIALILVQAGAIAWAVSGVTSWVDDGNELTTAAMESDELPFTEVIGFIVHGINGQMLIPLVGLILLIISFFAKVSGGVKWAAMLFVGILVQVALGLFAHGLPFLGLLHGINALLLFWLAFRAAKAADEVGDPVVPRYEATSVS